ncbi:MAG: glycosyltransferase family 4 protein [Cyanobacteriota bacterium]
MKKLKVIMLGPSLKEKGGMGSVGTLIQNTAPAGVQIQHISTWDGEPSRQSSVHRLKVFIGALIVFLWKLLKGEVDVVHIHLAERGSALRKAIITLIAMAFRKPVFMHAHGCEFHAFHGQLRPRIKQVLNWVLQQSTYLIALSESWKDYYVTNCGLRAEQVVVLPNPVEIPKNVPDRADSHKKINIVFLGRIGKRKGVYDLLQAFAKLAPEHREKAEVILAGIGEMEKAQSLAESLDIQQHVKFPGWVDPKLRNQLLFKADVFVLPSYNEGLPMALLEAMSWGLPVITTPVGGIPEVITDKENGLLVNPGDVQQLSQALQSLITSQSLRLNLGSAARQRVAPLDVKLYSQSLFELYCSAVKTNKKPDIEPSLPPVVTTSRCR